MQYDLAVVSKDYIGEWDDDNLFVLRYWTRRSGRANATTDLILGFKNGDQGAIELAASQRPPKRSLAAITLRVGRNTLADHW